jgi:hypothetical protein
MIWSLPLVYEAILYGSLTTADLFTPRDIRKMSLKVCFVSKGTITRLISHFSYHIPVSRMNGAGRLLPLRGFASKARGVVIMMSIRGA